MSNTRNRLVPLAVLALCLAGASLIQAAPDNGLGQRPYMIGGTRSGHQFTQVSVSGGVVTLTRTFSGTASAPSVPANWSSATAGLGSYQVTVHPTPYNWHITGVTNDNYGTMIFQYKWSSTSGNVGDLSTCYIHEYVTYDGPVGTALFPIDYTMPVPFDGVLHNPTVLPGPGQQGKLATDPNGVPDYQRMPSLSSFPHRTGGFTATQKYEFDDTATGEDDTLIPGPDAGPLSIMRSVYSSDGVFWYYKLTKSGYTITQSI